MRHGLPIFFVILLTAGCKQKEGTLFVILPSSHSGVTFVNKIEETPEINILTYEYTYNGGGVAAADFNNDGLCDLYFTGNTVENKLYLNQGKLTFKDITASAGVKGRPLWKTGVAVADVNADGWLDIYVCYSGPDLKQSLSNELYINNGVSNGQITFSEQAVEYGLDAAGTFSTQAAFFDYDRDGDLDMFLVNHGNHFYSPFINTNKLRNTRHPNFGNRLYRNDSDHTSHHFTEVSDTAGIHGGGINFGLGVSISDVNNDGWPDIFVTNDYEEQDFFYLNKKDGTFSDASKKSFDHFSRNGMGTDFADYSNDGKVDLMEVDMWPEDNFRQKLLKGPDDNNRYQLMLDSGFYHQQMRNTLQLNSGNLADGVPVFSEVGQLAGVSATDWSWAPLFIDADNDGFKDLFVTNGYLRDFTSMDFMKFTVEDAKKKARQQGQDLKLYELISKMSSTRTSDYLFKNNGNLTFSNFTKQWGIDQLNLSFGATYADLDNDGDVELITNNTNEAATIWENQSAGTKSNAWLRVKLEGLAGNKFGIGTKVFIETREGVQLQELFTTRGYQSSVEPILHFGLGSNNSVSKIRVIWPDGKQTELTDQKANQLIKISYAGASSVTQKENPLPVAVFKDVSSKGFVDFIHNENRFVDVDKEPLLPYQLSRSGPALAKGDVNNDGADDFYIGGAAGQKSVLYLSTDQGFIRNASQPWEEDALNEDTGAVFFDVDGDHDFDLFVVSGGNEIDNGSRNLDDRLYINTGGGRFVKALEGTTPSDGVNGSCVTAADYDKDGDVDLFVGGRVLPGAFPTASPGAILKNESKNGIIRLVVATPEVNQDLRELGMVTDAVWTDFNNDTWPDLLIVGEWMPVRLFKNQKGTLVEVHNDVLENSSGLWNRIAAADVDNDGDIDYVVGNAGTNLPWHPTISEPLTLYMEDINNDGRIDPIMCSYSQGKSYPVASRDELLLQLPPLRKRFTNYSSYGNASINEILDVTKISPARIKKINNLRSSILKNSGNGKFELEALPIEAQFSSVRGIIVDDFNGDEVPDILLAGNFYPFRTQYGPCDASKGLLLVGKGDGIFKVAEWARTGFYAPGDIRNMTELVMKSHHRMIVVARNNQSALVFESIR